MERKADIFGIFKHTKYKNIAEHLQSWFIGVSKQVFLHKEFDNFICNITKQKDKEAIIHNYEIGLSALFRRLGFSMTSFLDSSISQKYYNLPSCEPLKIIKTYHFPFLKRNAITLIFVYYKELIDLFSCISYDKNLILNHLLRTQDKDKIIAYRLPKFSFCSAYIRFYSEYSGVSGKYHIILQIFSKKIFTISLPVPKRLLYFSLADICKKIR